MGGFFYHDRHLCPGGDRYADLGLFLFASRDGNGANTTIAMNIVRPTPPSPKTAGCRRFARKKNLSAGRHQHLNRKCITAARSPAKAPQIWRLPFVVLPRAKRDAMSALYAFCREVDDAADAEAVPVEKRRAQLADWRTDVRRACENQTPEFVINQEFQPIIRKYHLPFTLFDELIKGCEMDLDIQRHEILSNWNFIVIALRRQSVC